MSRIAPAVEQGPYGISGPGAESYGCDLLWGLYGQ